MSIPVTIRTIRELYSLRPNVIDYAIDRYGPKPIGRIGITRIWSAESLPAIEAALRKTGALKPDCEVTAEDASEDANVERAVQ